VTATAPEAATERIARVAASDVLLVALDFDGTLSHTVDEPMSARMIPAARAALGALAAAPRTHVALVSGRSLADLRVIAEHDDASPWHLAGSHGIEYWHPGESGVEGAPTSEETATLDQLADTAEGLVADLDGAWIERKSFGFGVHTRLSEPDAAAAAQQRVDDLIAREAPDWRRRTGHDIVEYAFREGGKDDAVRRLADRVGATAVVFAGDDVTDEDALRALGPTDLGVRVGAGETAAAVRVGSPEELAALLQHLADARG